MKNISFILLLLVSTINYAQLKLGNNPQQIVSGAFFQINGGATPSTLGPSDQGTLIFNSNNRLGIGTLNPQSDLDIVNNGQRATFGLRNSSSQGHNWYLNSESNGDFHIWDSSANNNTGAPRFFIKHDGFIGLGTDNPNAELDVVSSTSARTAFGLRNTGGHNWYLNSEGATSSVPGAFLIWDSSATPTPAGAGRFIILANGDVGVGEMSPTSKLHVAGGIKANSIEGPSDVRFKKNIKPLQNSLSKITSLNGYNYEWRNDEFPSKNFNKGIDIGLIAQEVEKVYPEVVFTANDEMQSKSIDYSKLVPALVESIKELKAEVEELKSLLNLQITTQANNESSKK